MEIRKAILLISVCAVVSMRACQTNREADVLPTVAPTLTLTLTPTPTVIPLVIPTPVSVITLSPTPLPVENTKVLEIKDIQAGDLKIREIITDVREVEICYAYGNVMVTYSDGKYGALDYDGNLLVENIYETVWVRPNSNGDFALGDKETAIVFNSDGEKMLEVKSPREMFINEKVVTYIVDTNEEFGLGYAYDLRKEKYISTFAASYVSVMSDGKFYISDQFELKAIDIDGNAQILWDYWKVYDGKERIIPLLFEGMRDGYGTVSCICTSGYHMGIISEDGEELILLNPNELASYAEFGLVEECGIFTYQEEGVRYANIDKKIVVYLENENKTRFFLIDFAKAENNSENPDATFLQSKVVSNFSEIVIAEYDSICMSPSGNHAATEGGTYLYFDDAGKVLGEYEQNMYFRRAHGLIMDENSDAYLIDTNCQKVYGGIPADGITLAGNAFCVKNGNQRIYWLVEYSLDKKGESE